MKRANPREQAEHARCANSIDAEKPEILVEISRTGRQCDRLDPVIEPVPLKLSTAPSPAASLSRTM